MDRAKRLQVARHGVALMTVSGLLLSACSSPAAITPTSAPVQPTVAVAQPTSPPAQPTNPPPTAAPTDTTAPEPTEVEAVTLRFAAFGDPAEIAAYEAVVEGFKAEHPEITINIEATPSQGDYMQKLAAAFTAGDAPDVLIVSYRRFGQFASTGALEPLEPRMEQSDVIAPDQFYPVALDAYRLEGEAVCIPQNISSPVIYYNKNLFDDAGVAYPSADWTWVDFVQTARDMTKDNDGDGSTDVYGFDTSNETIRIAPFVWQNGGEMVDDTDNPTMLTLDSPEAVEALQWFSDLQLLEHVRPNREEAEAEDFEARFMSGGVAMVMSSRVSVPGFREITDFEWDVVGLPKGDQEASVLHSDGYCMAEASEHKDEAWAFIEYALGPEGQTATAELGRTVPSLISVAESDVFLNSTPPANNQAWLDAAAIVRRLPNSKTWSNIEGVINEEIIRAVYGDATAEEAAAAAVTNSEELFRQANE